MDTILRSKRHAADTIRIYAPARSPRTFRSRFGNKWIRSGDDDGRPAPLGLYGATGFGMPGMQTAPALRRPIFFAHQHIAGSRNSAALRQFHGYSLGVGGFRFPCLSPRYLFGNYRGCRDDRLLLRRCAARALMHNAEKCRIKYLGSGNPVISAAPVQQNPL